MKQRFWLVLAGSLLVSSLGHAQDKTGTAGVQFLKLGVSARAAGMGDAYVALADDASALYYNPAGMTSLYGGEALFSHVDLYSGMGLYYEFAGVILPGYVGSGRLGVSMQALHTDDMAETTTLLPEGTGRYFRASEYAVTTSYALELTDKFSSGFSFRYITSNLGDLGAIGNEAAVDGSASSWSVDVGTMYRTGYRGINFGMAITNFGADLQYLDEPTPLPINFKVGLSGDLLRSGSNAVILALEGAHPNDNAERGSVGIEYSLADMLALRAGRRFSYEADSYDETTSFGAGIYLRGGDFRFDYAYTTMQNLPEVHRYTVAMRF